MRKALLLCVLFLGGGMVCAQQGVVAVPGAEDEKNCTDAAAIRAAQRIVDAWKDGYNSGNAARAGAL